MAGCFLWRQCRWSCKEMKRRPIQIVTATVVIVILLHAMLSSSPFAPDDYTKFSYKFVRVYKQVNLTGSTVNPIPAQVTWQQDLSHKVICNGSDPFIITMVPSAIPNFKQRDYIRHTWGNPNLYLYSRMRTIFVLGKTLNSTLQDLVNEEIQLYDDIIQYNFIDSYRNLTYKTLAWMSWAQEWCPEVPWVAKIDDDVMVNPFHLKTYLADELKKNSSPVEIIGRLREKNKPMRAGKWKVTKEEYDLKYYPPFVLGPAYIVSANAVERLVEYASYTPPLWLEDVYITGLVASAAGVKRIQTENTLFTRKLTRKLYANKVAFLVGADEKRKKSAWIGIIKYSPAKQVYKK